jgi:hypothetical protein
MWSILWNESWQWEAASGHADATKPAMHPETEDVHLTALFIQGMTPP